MSNIKNKGRIIYIEPTDFAEYKIHENGQVSEGVKLDNISWNLEDLQFNIDLRVVSPDRFGSLLPIKSNNDTNSNVGFTSFLQGNELNGSNYLTDSYTDITFQEISPNGESKKESLGIDSVDINFDSHFFPMVDIKFTDVRAAALFGPTDNEYVHNKRIEAISNNNDLSEAEKTKYISEEKNKMSSSFFKSLFHFPYPRFMLSVMGFYGEKITFQLAVNDFKTSFNSTNGNFDVNVSFIGYMYGLYTDLPMSLIFTAPYYNAKYWNDNAVSGGRFCYNEGQPILKFIDFLYVYYRLEKETNEEDFSDAENLKLYKKLNDGKNLLEDILMLFDEFDAQFTTDTNNIITYHMRTENPKAFIVFDIGSTVKVNEDNYYNTTTEKYKNLVNAINTYNSVYASNDNDRVSVSYLANFGGDKVKYSEIENGKITSPNSDIKEINDVVNELNSIRNHPVRGIKDEKGTNTNNEEIYFYSRRLYFIYYRGDLKENVSNLIKKYSSEIEKRRGAADDEMLSFIEKKLTFKPTIENVFRMIFAHIDTFIDALKSNVLENIKTSIGNGDGKRTAGYLGLTNKNSDITPSFDSNTKIAPFPLCKDEKKCTYEYPGTFFGANSNLNEIVEVDFVEKITESIKDFNKRAEEIKTLIESLSDTEKSIYDLVSITDIFNKGENPYIVLKDKLSTLQDDHLKACYIMYFVGARLLMYIISKGYKNEDSIKDELNSLLTTELSYFEQAGITISNVTKAHLTSNTALGLNGGNVVYPKYVSEENKNALCYHDEYKCYYFKDPFNKDNIGNLFVKNSNVLTVLDNSYNESIKHQVEKDVELEDNKKLVNNTNSVNRRSNWEQRGYGYDEYSISYVNSKNDSKGEIGFAGDAFEKGKSEFNSMYGTSLANGGDSLLYDYHAGFLQIGERRGFWDKEFDSAPNKSTDNIGGLHLLDDLYLGIAIPKYYTNAVGDNTKKEVGDYINDSNEPAMYNQANKYFRAFLLLGCLSTYFNQEHTTLFTFFETTYYDDQGRPHVTYHNEEGKLFKFPKVLLLYYGACIYFRKDDYKNYKDGIDSGTINNKSYSLMDLNLYMKDTDKIIVNSCKQYVIKTFTSREFNEFIGPHINDCTTISVSEGAMNDLENYFINWVDNGDFKLIDDVLSNIESYDVVRMKNPDSVFHAFKETQFKIRPSDSIQDFYIKKLLCEDLNIYKKPEIQSLKSSMICYNSGSDFTNFFKTFFKDYKTEEDIKEEERKEEEKKVTNVAEQKKALYYTLKRLYDKWLSSYNLLPSNKPQTQDVFMLNLPFIDKLNRRTRYTTNSDVNISSEFNSFIFVDSFFRDISDKFLTNPDIFAELINSYTNREIINSNTSVFEFMNEIAEKNGLLFASLPIYSNFYDVNTITNMFSPNKKYDTNKKQRSDIPGNTYVIMYTGEASSKLDLGQDSEYDGDGIVDIEDVFECAEDKIPTLPSELHNLINEGDNDDIDFILPVFGVTFGKQNQMYFKNITVNMDNPKMTDYSIANLIQISYGGAHGDSEDYNVGVGQDLYSIYSNRSYTCTVEMLGCLNIMPMMYFQLNNIPMFRGLYIIINVSHSVVPGNITTKFTGVRVSKNHIGLVKTVFSFQQQLDKINTGDISINFDNVSINFGNDGEAIGNGSASQNSKPSKKLSGDWLKNVETIGEWYEKNIHTYCGGALGKSKGIKWWYECPLIGDTTVSDDCSGFVKACLQAQGISALDKLSVSTTTMQPGSKFEQILKENGFERLDYVASIQKQGDILIGGPGSHTEIYWTPKTSYGWGNIHDINRQPGMPYYRAKIAYKYIYRKK